jgi:hypothetical protein
MFCHMIVYSTKLLVKQNTCYLFILVFLECFEIPYIINGERSSVEVKALCYKPEGRWFDTLSGDLFKFA